MLREVTYAEGKQAVIEVRGKEAPCCFPFLFFFFQSGGGGPDGWMDGQERLTRI